MKKPVYKKRLIQLVKMAVIIYALAGILLWYFQERLLFQSTELPLNHQFAFASKHRELLLPVNDKETLSIVQFYAGDSTPFKGVVLYFHGNKENIRHYEKYTSMFTTHGYDVWMMDYPTFGKSRGTLKEQRFYADAAILYKMALQKTSSDSIIIYGKSLGTGIATELASHQSCKQLILETPYYSLPSLAAERFPIYPASRMLRYRFPLFEYLQEVKAPVTVFHGTEDEVIPYSNAARLKSLLKNGDEFITIEGGEHNNLSSYNQYLNKLDALLKR